MTPSIPFIVCVIVGIVVGKLATPYMGIATTAYGLMVCGLIYKYRTSLHTRFMLGAIGLDLFLVLFLEYQRHAIETALAFKLSPLQQAHIGVSTLATVLYFPVLYLGITLWRDYTKRERLIGWHKKIGITAFVFRTLGFILMFSLLAKYRH